jgi:hypothetical protein
VRIGAFNNITDFVGKEKYPLASLVSRGTGVLSAKELLHKQETPEVIKKGIKLLLKKSPSLDKKVLDIFTRSAEAARFKRNRFFNNKKHQVVQMKNFLKEFKNIQLGLSALIKTKPDKKILDIFTRSAESVIKTGKGDMVGTIASKLSQLLKAKPDKKVLDIFTRSAESVIKTGKGYMVGTIASGLSQLLKAKADYKVLKLFILNVESVIKTVKGDMVGTIASGLSQLLKAKADYKVLELFILNVESAIKAGEGHSVGDIASELSKLVKAEADPEQISNLIIKILEINQSCYVGNQIDPEEFFRSGLEAAVKLELISPKIHKALINDLTQRKNPLQYHESIKICAELNEDDINKLKTFVRNKKMIFDNHQQFFVKVIAYYNLAKSLGIDVLAESPELNSINTKNDLSNYLAEKVLGPFANSLGIEMDPSIKYDKALKDWDLENLASLVATKDSWSEDDKKLFKLLIQAKLNNRTNEILDLTKNSKGQLTQEMETHNLNAEAWFEAHTQILESSSFSAAATKTTSQLSKEFISKFNAFSEYLKKNQLKEWDNLTNHQLVQEISNNDQWSQEKLRDFSETLNNRVGQEFTQGKIPEAVADLQNFIRGELLNHDPSKKIVPKEFKVAIWDPMDIGKNLFAGNRAGSCTALGQNASAIFKFILDPGTKYIYTKNQVGNITGYARVFLALDTNNKPKIFVDSVDGKAASRNDFQTMIPEVRNKVIELAQAIGLQESDIINRETKLESKLGRITPGYFHHAQFTTTAQNYRLAS